MPASPYLLRVLSKPVKTDDATWEKWYTDIHVPDVVNYGIANNGALFRAFNDFTLQTKSVENSGQTDLHRVQLSHFEGEQPNDKTFCAVYGSDLEHPMEAPRIQSVRTKSDMLPTETFHGSAEWDVRVYRLIQDYDPDGLGETPAPYTLHVQNEPADEKDYNDFYEKEHLGMLHKVPGYRRSQRYQLAHLLDGAQQDTPRYLAVHEFDHLNALDGPELREADASSWTHKVFGSAKAVSIRGFKSVYDKGFA